MIRIFFYPDATSYVLFTEQTLAHMYAYAQRWPCQREAGGELFSSTAGEAGLVIGSVTGPNQRDHRRRHAWVPDTAASDFDRQSEFAQGRNAVGLWHTHPEASPRPSALDQKTTWEYLDAFQGDRSEYLMVIVGNRGKTPEMAVWVACSKQRRRWFKLVESNEIISF